MSFSARLVWWCGAIGRLVGYGVNSVLRFTEKAFTVALQPGAAFKGANGLVYRGVVGLKPARDFLKLGNRFLEAEVFNVGRSMSAPENNLQYSYVIIGFAKTQELTLRRATGGGFHSATD